MSRIKFLVQTFLLVVIVGLTKAFSPLSIPLSRRTKTSIQTTTKSSCLSSNVKKSYLLSSALKDGGTTNTSIKAPPRTGFAQTLLNLALESPIWTYILVPQARNTMVKTAEANGVPWNACKEWIQSKMKDEMNVDFVTGVGMKEDKNNKYDKIPMEFPKYYQVPFHAYETGNLSWDAALEAEIASCAVGARNFPEYGSSGEDAFRGAFESALIEAVNHNDDKTSSTSSMSKLQQDTNLRIADFGCGSGMSTRRFASMFPKAKQVVGIDLSPYYVAVGKKLLQLAPISSFREGGPWVSTIEPDTKNQIEYHVCEAENTKLESNSFNIVNIQFVFHENPPHICLSMVDEAIRLLDEKNGQLWISEMDFESPGYAAQRANPLLFSLIRATEPYLDEYAESIPSLFEYVQERFEHVVVLPATGRHYTLVATNPIKGKSNDVQKGTMTDLRFNDDGTYRVEDTHLQVWESKSK